MQLKVCLNYQYIILYFLSSRKIFNISKCKFLKTIQLGQYLLFQKFLFRILTLTLMNRYLVSMQAPLQKKQTQNCQQCFNLKGQSKTKDRNYIIIDDDDYNYQLPKPRNQNKFNGTKTQKQMSILDQMDIKQKTGKYRLLSLQQKQQIVKKSWQTSIKITAEMYNISPNNIMRWRKKCQRKHGSGRKIKDFSMQAELLKWICLQNQHSLTKKLIQNKSLQIAKNPQFKASKGWYNRFLLRNQQLKKYIVKDQLEQEYFPSQTSYIELNKIANTNNQLNKENSSFKSNDHIKIDTDIKTLKQLSEYVKQEEKVIKRVNQQLNPFIQYQIQAQKEQIFMSFQLQQQNQLDQMAIRINL